MKPSAATALCAGVIAFSATTATPTYATTAGDTSSQQGTSAEAAAARHASTPKSWMTRKEYRKLKKGMPIEKVRKIVGSKGHLYYAYDSDPAFVGDGSGLPSKTRCYWWRTPHSNKGASIRFWDGKIFETSFLDSPYMYYLT